MSIIAFASYVANLQSPPVATRDLVRLHLIDVVGALIAASGTPEGGALLRFRAGQGSDLSINVATLSGLARLSEIDDIHLASMTTPGGIVIPSALAIAATRGADPDALLTAILAGYEAMIRLGLAIDGPSILYRGIWPTYFTAPFAVAAVSACLFGLDAEQTAHALALALTYAAPGVSHHNAPTTSRWLAAGHAAANGLRAAQASRDGFTADTGLLDGNFFPGIYAITPKREALTDALGGRDLLTETSFKPWCAARQTMPATQALKEILDEGVSTSDIVGVKAVVLPPHRRMIDHGITPGDRASHLTSVIYNMAVAAAAPQLADQISPSGVPIPPAATELMRKITVEADEGLLADYPRVWPAEVTVRTATGARTRRVDFVPGDPARPFDEREVTAKFRRFVTPAIGESDTAALLDAIDDATPAALLERLERVLRHCERSEAIQRL